jgi:hypothetical protein
MNDVSINSEQGIIAKEIMRVQEDEKKFSLAMTSTLNEEKQNYWKKRVHDARRKIDRLQMKLKDAVSTTPHTCSSDCSLHSH